MNDTASPAGASAAEARPLPVAKTVLCGALLGTTLLLGVLNLCSVIQYRAEQSFVGGIGTKVHEGLRWPASLVWPKFGLPEDLGIRLDIRTLFVVGTLAAIGLLLGALTGLFVGLLRRGRTVAPPRPTMPWIVPLGMAVLGIFYQGYIWCNLAVLLLPRARRRTALTVAVMAIAFVAVLAWSCVLEVDWQEGWSKRYPWARSLFFQVGHDLGAKE